MARFQEMSRDGFKEEVDTYPWKRKINSVHMHHTWQPRHSNWKGRAHVVGMWRYHTKTNGWSDIAQHITIAPDGGIWTGRNWNSRPISSRGANGKRHIGPFMFETVGNFDKGHDKLEGEQLRTVIFVIAYMQHKFKLPFRSLKFHNMLGSPKTCPGSGVEYWPLLDMVEEYKMKMGWD